jgi:hypothetical protein
MAEESNRKFEVPWGTLLPLLAALGGIVAQFKPLISARPPAPLEKSIEVIAAQDVDARLWQDPLVVAAKQRDQLEADKPTKGVSQIRIDRHSLGALVNKVSDTLEKSQSDHLLLLAVMLDAGPYTEQAESRLRAREAVLEGLSESGFVPVDGEHIGFVNVPWPPAAAPWPDTSTDGGALLVPWEECEAARNPTLMCPADTTNAIVLWLPAANFAPTPLQFLAGLVAQFPRGIDIKIIGPASSDGLEAMLCEANSRPPGLDPLDGVSILSARASASANELVGAGASDYQLQLTIEGCVTPQEHGGLTFLRTVASDDQLRNVLINELGIRHVSLTPRDSAFGDHVVILTELDNKYGRSLANMFSGYQTDIYHYLHGIDGRLPGDLPKQNQLNDTQKNQTATASAAVEATEGQNQSDFLRRLARELKNEDIKWGREEGKHLRAIGLLGSDIFDKLMILRALRPEFPDAIFFTNNFDAQFELRDVWDDARNLVIASPFGSVLPDGYQGELAPFRDTNQISMFAATLVATTVISPDKIKQYAQAPYLFEVGRNGIQQLKQDTAVPILPTSADPLWFREWLQPYVLLCLFAAALFLLLLTAKIAKNIVSRKGLTRPGLSEPRGGWVKHLLSKTPVWLICGVPVIVLLVAWFAQNGDAAKEPLAFFSGISIWPSEMIRLTALLLAVHFMIKARLALRANEAEINARYCLHELRQRKSLQHRCRKLWRRRSTPGRRAARKKREKRWKDFWFNPGEQFSARRIWFAYLRRNRFWRRTCRVLSLWVLYFAFSVSITLLFGRFYSPARGDVASRLDFYVILFSSAGLLALTFYVVDAILLNGNFIRVFSRGLTTWAKAVDDCSRRIPPLEKEDLAKYHDIFFVAQRTEVVAQLIWYPLIVLTLMFAARSSYFDNWTWPASLIVIFVLNTAWALGSAIFLRRTAEQLRSSALENLRLARLRSYADPLKREMFDELIPEIRDLKKGAFAPLSEQPFIRAVLVPSGSLGLFAVAQRLFDLF